MSLAVLLLAASLLPGGAQGQPAFSAEEKPIVEALRGIRRVPDDQRGAATRRLAEEIRRLPETPNKLYLVDLLASRATEGDFGHETLQEVAMTLAEALREQPLPDQNGGPADSYMALAQLIRYEQVRVPLDAPPLRAALARLEELDRRRASAGFALRDLEGKEWKLTGLRGKVVLLNFWATWCSPCRKEVPDLAALYARFEKNGLVVLGISDDDPAKVAAFVKEHAVPYPVLLDPGGKVSKLFGADGIPKSFVYDRGGKLVATAIDMRTMGQFLAMLAKAGLK